MSTLKEKMAKQNISLDFRLKKAVEAKDNYLEEIK